MKISESIITDIHTHVLPGVDDGPESLDAALRLVRAHKQTGTHRIFCTSHLGSPHFNNAPEELTSAFFTLSATLHGTNEVPGQEDLADGADTLPSAPENREFQREGDDREGNHREAAPTSEVAEYPILKSGAEIRVNPRLTELLVRSEAVPTLGETNYVLLEYPNSELNERLLDVVHELRVRGYRTIMAHPERSLIIQKDPGWIDAVLDAGLLLQLTALCLEKPPTGRSHMADKLAWTILERGAAAVIASDAHDPAYRPPGLMTAYDTISQRLGSNVSDALIANANAIWNNEPIHAVPVEKRKRGLFRR